jgi:hypothetical protein
MSTFFVCRDGEKGGEGGLSHPHDWDFMKNTSH